MRQRKQCQHYTGFILNLANFVKSTAFDSYGPKKVNTPVCKLAQAYLDRSAFSTYSFEAPEVATQGEYQLPHA